MTDFLYVARDSSGAMIKGVCSASDRLSALSKLCSESKLVVSLSPSAPSLYSRGPESLSLSRKELSRFFDQLSQLIGSGIPLLRALTIINEQAECRNLRTVLQSFRESIRNGATISRCMSMWPCVFDELVVSVTYAGEEGGFLEEAFSRIHDLLDKQEDLRGRIQGALIYPLILLVVGSVVFSSMLVWFVPKFEPLFAKLRAGNELPIPTSVLLAISRFCQNHGLLLGIGLLFFVGLLLWASRLPDATRTWDQWRLKVPYLGSVWRDIALSRFCRTMGTLLGNGVPLLKALQISRSSSGNHAVAEAISDAASSVATGKTLSHPLRSSRVFTREVVEMISVGESANRLDIMMSEISERMDTRIHRQLDALIKLIEPCLMLFIAVMVGFLVIALLLPVLAGNGI